MASPSIIRGLTVLLASSSHGSRGAPIFELLPQGRCARSGQVWVGSSTDGLLIEGEVSGPAPIWPQTRAEMLAKDHVEVWLAAEPQLALPPVGWGNPKRGLDGKWKATLTVSVATSTKLAD